MTRFRRSGTCSSAANPKFAPQLPRVRLRTSGSSSSPAVEEDHMTNAAPRKGDVYLKLIGVDSYVEISSIKDYSIATTGELSVAAWIRPDTLNFPRWEGTGYVHWLGKGDSGQHEWTFRMYSRDHTAENPPRPHRISFYAFNPDGGLGVGSYFRDTLHKGSWIFVVGVADSTRTYIYRDGRYRRCDTYRG